MAKRSLKASQYGIAQAKRSFDLKGWTQEYLAAEVGLQTRQPVWKFFSGRPVERHIFIDICFTLDLDWEDIVDRTAFVTDAAVPTVAAQGEGDGGAEDAMAQARSRLLTLAQAQCQLLELPLDLHQPMTLAQIYTDAYLRPYQRLGPAAQTPPVAAPAAVQPHSRVLVLGGPGAGKTTLLQHLALEIGAGHLQAEGQPWLPVFLRLRQLALVPTAELNVQQYLNQRWLAAGLSPAQIDRLWQQGQLWLLLDGWDELPSPQHRLVTQQLQTLLDTYPGLRVLLSGRSGGPMPHLNGLVTLELATFTAPQIERFVQQWFVANHPAQGAELAQTCLEALHHPDNDRLREMALTPILLHLMCLVFYNSGQFPNQRSKLYQQALDLLLGQWDQQRGISRSQPLLQLSTVDLLGILCEVAARSFEQGSVILDEAELLGLIARALASRDPQATPPERRWADSKAILQVLIEHYGMLSERELGSYAFAHLSFQEYLTARRWALTALEQPAQAGWADLATHLSDARWREVIVLTFEMAAPAEALGQALWHQSQRYGANHPELQPWLAWAQTQAERSAIPYHPAALRGFYLGLGLNRGLDLALAIDARLAIDLPPPLALDQALTRLLHQGQQWLTAPTRQAGLDLVFAMDLQQRFALAEEFTHDLHLLQTQLLDTLEAESDLATWCDGFGTEWLRSLSRAVAAYRHWDIDLVDPAPCPALETYCRIQQLLIDCLRHNRTLAAAAVRSFENSLVLPEVQCHHA
ncbi:NACHT domain-containing protein [Nodosilinea sp. PGN35]|uniref:NACHT domain-containing protein n=1 Tax=Nodosilinea sp. PGN35 TaxID=3020489 RepID=UPI0023B2FB59|nr:NACHT domain-containing protein [Nodosilinea sp. TSF1-S3]MDF0369726.1 NACHT domain-containing protein [Nodosilinea sp. TSF1-S3]